MVMEYIDAPPAIKLADLSPNTGPTKTNVADGIDFERIKKAREAEPQNWITYYGHYDGWRYSLLDQITPENARKLQTAWCFQFGAAGMHAGGSTYAFEASPIVVDGIMYVSGWDGWIWALDAANGDMIWQYKHAIPFDVSLCCGNVNRGVAVADGKVIATTLNAHVIALDAQTGQKIWDTVNGDVRAGETLTVAPLIVKDMVLIGSSGGEFGVRGHIDAYDIATGERRWRRYNIPKPDEPGGDTWGDAEQNAWARGGANAWVTGTYDPELNLVYWGTGNPAPDFDGEVRPGDNLYTDSVIAFDPDNGELKWHYQFTPHDVWDYDSNMEMILHDFEGKKALTHFDKNGYWFVLDRTNGDLLRVTPFVDRITWGEITPHGDVKRLVYPDGEGENVHFFPGPAGAKEWTHASYNPDTDMFYVPVQELGATVARRRREFREGMPYWGAAVTVDSDESCYGYVRAYHRSTGEIAWEYKHQYPVSASTLVTKGKVVFCGMATGEFICFHAETGEVLWKFQTGSGHHSSPVTYEVNGEQYIAVPIGWGSWVEGFAPGMLGGPHGNSVFAFKLPSD